MFNQQLVNLRIDFAFKQLFGTNGSEDILIAFLNAMLQESLESPIASLQLEDPHLHREHANDKLSILDISATLDTGTKVNVEIQLNNNHDMMKRSLSTLTGSKTPTSKFSGSKEVRWGINCP